MHRLPTISAAQAEIRGDRLTPIDLVEYCLARIEAFDEQIRAWVVVDADGARREAARLTELAKRGEFVGPLHGIPIGVKDIIDVAGLPTRCGSPLRENAPPAEKDAAVVAMLRRAGAIILGKTVTTEWACFDPPPTRNPWNLDRTPGGSSSGSAAAVAMEMCMAALGTQTGGSILRPAAYCGVCGLKPSWSPEMMDGIAPVSFHLDHVGPIARSVVDVSQVYAAIAGSPIPPTESELRFALIDDFFFDVADDVCRVVDEQWKWCMRELCKAEAVRLPLSAASLRQNHLRIMAVEAAGVHRETFAAMPHAFGVKMRSLIETGLQTGLFDYVQALQHQHEFRRELQSMADRRCIWTTPTTPTTAPGPETTGDAQFNVPWSYAGWPAITLPCGFGDDHLPVGLQLIASPGCEMALLSAAAAIEERLGSAVARPAILD